MSHNLRDIFNCLWNVKLWNNVNIASNILLKWLYSTGKTTGLKTLFKSVNLITLFSDT